MNSVLNECIKEFGDSEVSSGDLYAFLTKKGLNRSFTPLLEYKIGRGRFKFSESPLAPKVELTDEQISARISDRFRTLQKMTEGSVSGIVRSLIISGPGGLGKTHTVEQVISTMPEERYRMISGRVSGTGLYRTLYEMRFSKCVVVFDDADDVFFDDVSINLLKKACDSSSRRRLSWLSKAELFDEGGDLIPSTFEFEGSVIFISNCDFQAEVDKNSKLSPHMGAMISRSHYIDLGIKTNRDYIIRIKQVIADSGMLSDMKEDVRDSIVSYIEQNQNRMRELSLRMVLKLADLVRMDPIGWKTMAETTCMRF